MDEKIPSPPKPVRLVQMSPAGMVCSPYNMAVDGTTGLPNQSPSIIALLPFMATPHVPTRTILNVEGRNETFGIQSPVSKSLGESGHGISIKQERIAHTCDVISTVDLKDKQVATTSLELEGMMVEDAVMTLPEVVNEVVHMQKGQLTEIQRQQLILHNLKGKIKFEKENNEELVQEISSVTHKIYLTQEDAKERMKKCKNYEKDIDALVCECESIKRNIQEKKEEFRAESDSYKKYQSKIENHVDTVTAYESDMQVHKDVRNMQERLKLLKNKEKEIHDENELSKQILNGDLENEIEGTITEIIDKISAMESKLYDERKLIVDEKEKQSMTEQTIHVLHKKNSAQLTRLKKQLREVHMRSRRWNDQIFQLKKTVDNLTKSLEE